MKRLRRHNNMMARPFFLIVSLIVLSSLGPASVCVAQDSTDAQQAEATQFKQIEIRTGSRLAIGKRGPRMEVSIPRGTQLFETAREDTFWARIEPTENLQNLLRTQGLLQSVLNNYIQSDWYFNDKSSKSSDGFDSDPVYFMADWFQGTSELEQNYLVLTVKPEVDSSLQQWLLEDIKRGRVVIQGKVTLSGNRVLAEGVTLAADGFTEGKLRILISSNEISVQAGERITVSWGGTGVEATDSYYENQTTSPQPPVTIIVDPSEPPTIESLQLQVNHLMRLNSKLLWGGSALAVLLILVLLYLLLRYHGFWRQLEKYLRDFPIGLETEERYKEQETRPETNNDGSESIRFRTFLSRGVLGGGLTRQMKESIRLKDRIDEWQSNTKLLQDELNSVDNILSAIELDPKTEKLKLAPNKEAEEYDHMSSASIPDKRQDRESKLWYWQTILNILKEEKITDWHQLRIQLQRGKRYEDLISYLSPGAEEKDVDSIRKELTKDLDNILSELNKLLPQEQRKYLPDDGSFSSIVVLIVNQVFKINTGRPNGQEQYGRNPDEIKAEIDQFRSKVQEAIRFEIQGLARPEDLALVRSEVQAVGAKFDGLRTAISTEISTQVSTEISTEIGGLKNLIKEIIEELKKIKKPRPWEQPAPSTSVGLPRLKFKQLLENAKALSKSEDRDDLAFSEHLYEAIEDIKKSTVLPTDHGAASRFVDLLVQRWRPGSEPILERLFDGTEWAFLVPKRGGESYKIVRSEDLSRDDLERAKRFAREAADESRVILEPSIYWGTGTRAQLFKGKIYRTG